MNDKLKQSLQGRLSGMRWGEREQAEVFRQIQRKELHEVKHVKRGTSLLALAALMLFLVMGAAFALTGREQPDDTTRSAAASQGDFAPVPDARLENDYLILTVDGVRWTGENVSIDTTITLKEPDSYGLALGGYSNPGGYGREMIDLTLHGSLYAAGTQQELPPLTTGEPSGMTREGASVSLSGAVLTTDSQLDVELTLYNNDSQPAFHDTLTFRIGKAEALPEPAATDDRQLIIQNELITGYLTQSSFADGQATITIDVEPRKPWYAINTMSSEKSLLTVRADYLEVYDVNDFPASLPAVLVPGSKIAGMAPPVAQPAFIVTATENGARFTTTAAIDEDLFAVCFWVNLFARDANAGSIVNCPVYITVYKDSFAPQAPAGEQIGGTEHFSLYLEGSWYDGFSAEATIRIRADDPDACRLAIAPNADGTPDADTWVVSISDEEDDYLSDIECSLIRDAATGDVIAQISYVNLHATESSSMAAPARDAPSLWLDLLFRATNELTWAAEEDEFTLTAPISGDYQPEPLYLYRSSIDGLFLQGSVLTTDRCRYIGVMLAHDLAPISTAELLDNSGNVVASGSYVATSGRSLSMFPRTLFPYTGSEDTRMRLIVMAVDKDDPLPELITLRLTGFSQQPEAINESLTLSTTPIEPAHQPSKVSLVNDQNILFDNDLMTVRFAEGALDEGCAIAHLTATLKEPERYTFVRNDPDETKTFLSTIFLLVDADQPVPSFGSSRFICVYRSNDTATLDVYLHGSSDAWRDAAPSLIIQLIIRSEDFSIDQTHSVEFTFPSGGTIDRYAIEPLPGEDVPYFAYDSGELLAWEHLYILNFRYLCGAPYESAFIRLQDGGLEQQPQAIISNLKPDPDDLTLRQSTLYFEPFSGLEPSRFALRVQDFHSTDILAEFPIQFIPVTE